MPLPHKKNKYFLIRLMHTGHIPPSNPQPAPRPPVPAKRPLSGPSVYQGSPRPQWPVKSGGHTRPGMLQTHLQSVHLTALLNILYMHYPRSCRLQAVWDLPGCISRRSIQ